MANRSDKKKDRLIFVLFIIALLSVMLAMWALFGREDMPVLTPDHAPAPEENAGPIPDTGDGQDAEPPKGTNHVSLTYSDRVVIDLSKETAQLTFANPGKSAQDVLLQIEIRDQVIVQSGIIEPGSQVSMLELLPGSAQRLQEGIYEGQFHLYYYDPEDGSRADLDTIIPITITVKH